MKTIVSTLFAVLFFTFSQTGFTSEKLDPAVLTDEIEAVKYLYPTAYQYLHSNLIASIKVLGSSKYSSTEKNSIMMTEEINKGLLILCIEEENTPAWCGIPQPVGYCKEMSSCRLPLSQSEIGGYAQCIGDTFSRCR